MLRGLRIFERCGHLVLPYRYATDEEMVAKFQFRLEPHEACERCHTKRD